MSTPGLPAAAYAKLVDVDPPIAEHVIELLAQAKIPAYAEPLVGDTGPYRDVRAPDRPTTRIYVERTRLGAIVRAGVDDHEMVQGIGINLPRVMWLVFALGAMLAGLAGVLASPILGVYPGADFAVLMLAFAVVVIGGLGSLKGAFLASLFVGLVDNFGKALFPEFAMFTIFVPMAAVLAVRPTGLFGKA